MKRMTVVVLMFALLLAVAPSTLAKSTVSVNPLSLLVGVMSVEYETTLPALGSQMTLNVPVTYWGISELFGERITFFGVGAGVRYYLDGTAHQGIYFGGYGQMVTASVSGHSASGFGAVGVAGYKHIFDNGIVVDGGAAFAFGGGGAAVGPNLGVGYAF